jgi:hypothetical protein
MKKQLLMLVTLLLTLVVAYSQTRPITGRVVDETGTAVSGATVLVKGTSTGVPANANGEFTINAKRGDVLVISAMNYGSSEVTVGNASTINISLSRQAAALNEVVVTALGIRRERRSLTYATETINSDQLNRSGTGNPLNELEGKSAGLTVINSSGDPGSGTYIRLRGVTSITGNNQP